MKKKEAASEQIEKEGTREKSFNYGTGARKKARRLIFLCWRQHKFFLFLYLLLVPVPFLVGSLTLALSLALHSLFCDLIPQTDEYNEATRCVRDQATVDGKSQCKIINEVFFNPDCNMLRPNAFNCSYLVRSWCLYILIDWSLNVFIKLDEVTGVCEGNWSRLPNHQQ